MSWQDAQKWEADWHKSQQFNTYNEETKQYVYASKMGFDPFKIDYYGQISWDFKDKTIIDMGGSGQSILLKCRAKEKTVVDPILPSNWMLERYKEAGIMFENTKGELFLTSKIFDIGIIYNVLQHTDDPELILKNMRSYCREIHIFEYIETGTNIGHIHNLKEDLLNKWLGGYGKDEEGSGTVGGKFYYGIFKGEKYEG
jgi:2-polyprenyl-3-methyl-5-hydroxy-6-metoxy-1,4-benzoquinol methylase